MRLAALVFACLLPLATQAACPKSLVGTYSYIDTIYRGDGSVATGVGTAQITSNTAGSITYSAYSQSGLDGYAPEENFNTVPVAITFNSKTCIGKFVTPDLGEGLMNSYFVVANNGNTIYTLDGRGSRDTSTFFSGTSILTKQ